MDDLMYPISIFCLSVIVFFLLLGIIIFSYNLCGFIGIKGWYQILSTISLSMLFLSIPTTIVRNNNV